VPPTSIVDSHLIVDTLNAACDFGCFMFTKILDCTVVSKFRRFMFTNILQKPLRQISKSALWFGQINLSKSGCFRIHKSFGQMFTHTYCQWWRQRVQTCASHSRRPELARSPSIQLSQSYIVPSFPDTFRHLYLTVSHVSIALATKDLTGTQSSFPQNDSVSHVSMHGPGRSVHVVHIIEAVFKVWGGLYAVTVLCHVNTKQHCQIWRQKWCAWGVSSVRRDVKVRGVVTQRKYLPLTNI